MILFFWSYLQKFESGWSLSIRIGATDYNGLINIDDNSPYLEILFITLFLLLIFIPQFSKTQMQWIAHTKTKMTAWSTSSITKMKVANPFCLWWKSQVLWEFLCTHLMATLLGQNRVFFNVFSVCIWHASASGGTASNNILLCKEHIIWQITTATLCHTTETQIHQCSDLL